MAELLSDDAIAAGLAGLAWERDGDELVKLVTRKDFAGAMAFVTSVAEAAEAANHHPDIAISWNRVTLRLTTHSAGGLTSLDLRLAASIDELESASSGNPPGRAGANRGHEDGCVDLEGSHRPTGRVGD